MFCELESCAGIVRESSKHNEGRSYSLEDANNTAGVLEQSVQLRCRLIDQSSVRLEEIAEKVLPELGVLQVGHERGIRRMNFHSRKAITKKPLFASF